MNSKAKDIASSSRDVNEVADVGPQVFRGFIGGSAFVTKKGYRGSKIASLWVQNLFESFKNDDDELAAYALESELADLSVVVISGQFGTPYSIGDYGFYVDEQFNQQAKVLQENERIVSKGKQFLSENEWVDIDDKLNDIAHHGKYKFVKAKRGDSFASLAVRQNAFNVARKMTKEGIDPLVVNEEGHDLFDVIKQQYNDLGVRMKEVQEFKEFASNNVVVPSMIEIMIKADATIVKALQDLSLYCSDMQEYLRQRIVLIERDILYQRKCELKNEVFPPQKAWNVQQKDKTLRYITECDELKFFIADKLHQHDQHTHEFTSLTSHLKSHYEELQKEQLSKKKNGGVDGDSVITEDAMETQSNASFGLGGGGNNSSKKGGNKPPLVPLNSDNKLKVTKDLKQSRKKSKLLKKGSSKRLLEPELDPLEEALQESLSSKTRSDFGKSATDYESGEIGSIMAGEAKGNPLMGAEHDGSSMASASNMSAETEEFYRKMGIKQNDFMASSAAKRVDLQPVEVYAPTIGTFKETEEEVILYR